eukprot:PhF_6_TR10829/c0_g1_i3/m.17481
MSEDETFPVEVYYYDISGGMANQITSIISALSSQVGGGGSRGGSAPAPLEGIWHTAVVVHNREIYFDNGISWSSPGHTPFGTPLKRIPQGTTEVTWSDFRLWLSDMGNLPRGRFAPGTYSLVAHNCNHFTHEALQFLLGKGLPDEVVQLPQHVVRTGVQGLQSVLPALNMFLGGGRTTQQQQQPIPPSHVNVSEVFEDDDAVFAEDPFDTTRSSTEFTSHDHDALVDTALLRLITNTSLGDMDSRTLDIPPSASVTKDVTQWVSRLGQSTNLTATTPLLPPCNTSIAAVSLRDVLRSLPPPLNLHDISKAIEVVMSTVLTQGKKRKALCVVSDLHGEAATAVLNVFAGSAVRHGVRVVVCPDLSFGIIGALTSKDPYM